jgi:DNA ligase-1
MQTRDLEDGEEVEVQGSAAKPYILKNVGGVYSCTCPAWRHQSLPIERRSCKHLRALRGEQAELDRVGEAAVARGGGRRAAAKSGGATESKKKPPVLLAHSWDGVKNLGGWLMSEKLDGVRAYWDGTQFLSRQGNVYMAPDWFTEGLPDWPLDGELWGGRKQFQSTVGIVRRQDRSDHWKKISYLVFDAPAETSPFETRLEKLAAHFETAKPPYAKLLEHDICEDNAQLERELDRMDELGGEGLMLRRPGSRYVAGRSETLLKVKRFHDAEGRVIEHLPGAGKHKGRLGALLLELENGTRVSVGTGLSDAEREDPPAVGSIVTFRYQELTDGGVPRFPSYVRARADLDALPAFAADQTKTGSSARKKQLSKEAAPKPAPRQSVAPPAAAKTTQPIKPTAPARASGPMLQSARSDVAIGPARRLLTDEGASSRFWEVEQREEKLYIRFGRIDRKGQTRLKTFDTAAEAARAADKLVAGKRRQGFSPIDE